MTHKNNFWKEYSSLITIDEFYQFYNDDKSKDKSESSKIMWAIWYMNHPESIFFNMSDKKYKIAKDYLKDESFNWSSIENLISLFKFVVLSQAEQALINWGELISMRDKAMKELYMKFIGEEDIDSLVKLDKIITSTPKLFEDYKKIKKDYEEDKISKKGNKIKSLSDAGEV